MSMKNYVVCNRMVVNLIISSVKILFLVYLSLGLATCAPLYKTLYTNEKVYTIPVILPFIDPETEIGFIMNLINQSILCSGGAFIVPGAELTICMVKNNILVTAAVIENAITEYQLLLLEDKKFSNKHALQFKNIISQILDFNRFESFKVIYLV